MRNSLLSTQALCPQGRALAFWKTYRPRAAKVVIVNNSDYISWWPQVPADMLVIGRLYRAGDVDKLSWSVQSAGILADWQARCRDAGNARIDVWECVNEPVVGSADDMKRLAEFERRWAEILRSRGMKTCVGNFAMGNPEPDLMPHFRHAMEVADYFGYHGYGRSPNILNDKQWLIFRYRLLFEKAGYKMPVLLTEFGLDDGNVGYRAKLSNEAYISQLQQADKEMRREGQVVAALIFCLGDWGNWQSFDLTDNAAALLGKYIESEGDTAPGAPPAPSPDDVEAYLRNLAWNSRGIALNPDAAFQKYAQELALGAPMDNEVCGVQYGGRAWAYQAFAQGVVYCVAGQWDKLKWFKW